jgi:hypothetical protein
MFKQWRDGEHIGLRAAVIRIAKSSRHQTDRDLWLRWVDPVVSGDSK